MDTKKWYLSKGVWGSILVVTAIILRLVGHESIASAIENDQTAIVDWLSQAIGLVGGLLAFIGRIKAETKITT